MTQLWRAKTNRGTETIQRHGDRFCLIPPRHPNAPREKWGVHYGTSETELETVLRSNGGDGYHELSPFTAGEFHPRLWRGPASPTPNEMGLVHEWIFTVRSARLLFARMRELFHHIEPHRHQHSVFGLAQRELLMLACTEVESGWRAALLANGYAPSNPDRWSTTDYVKLLAPMRLAEWSVTLSAHSAYGPIAPFALWTSAGPTKSLAWYDAYNDVKHDREKSLREATFERAITALAAVFVMTIAQFGTEHIEGSPYFHADEFRIEAEPTWALSEAYIPPVRDHLGVVNGEWLGHERWTAKPHTF